MMEDKSIVYQNCSKCAKCHKVFCKDEVADSAEISKGYKINVC